MRQMPLSAEMLTRAGANSAARCEAHWFLDGLRHEGLSGEPFPLKGFERDV